MGLERGRISETQLAMLVISYILGTSLLFSPGREAGHDSWIALLLGLGEGLLFAFFYTALAARFPGKPIIEVFHLVYGRVGGKVVSALFIWYLLHLGSLLLTNFSDFFNSLILIDTPPVVIVFCIVLVCVYAVRHGLEVLARCAQFLLPWTLSFFILTSVLLLKDIRLEFFQPVMAIPLKRLVFSAHAAAAFPFGEAVVFLLAFPYLTNPQNPRKPMIYGLIFSGFFLLLNAVRNTGILGGTADLFLFPSFQAVRQINIGRILTRVEIIIAVEFLVMGFLKCGFLLYGAALGTAELLGLRTYRAVVYPLGILMALLSLLNFSNINENFEFLRWVYPFYALPFQVGIPILTMVVAMVRKLPQEEVGKE